MNNQKEIDANKEIKINPRNVQLAITFVKNYEENPLRQYLRLIPFNQDSVNYMLWLSAIDEAEEGVQIDLNSFRETLQELIDWNLIIYTRGETNQNSTVALSLFGKAVVEQILQEEKTMQHETSLLGRLFRIFQ